MSDNKTPVIIEPSEQETQNAQESKPSQSEPKATSKKASSNETKPQKKRSFFNWLNFFFILILFILFGFAAWYALNNQQSSVGELAIAKDRIQSLQQESRDLKSQLEQFKNQTSSLTANLDALQKSVEFNSTRLAKLPGAERQDWLLAEAEYLLRVANQRLQLEKDWQGSLGLLNAADKVLLETRDPGVNKIRKTISEEMLALKETPAIDKVGLVLQIQSIQNRIPELPWLPEKFIPEATQTEPQEQAPKPLSEQVWYKKAWASVVKTLSSMVRIRERAAPIAPALTANQRYYLQQNMQLMLEQAQLAALREEAVLYKQSIERVENWITSYIVLDNTTTSAIQKSLQELKSFDVQPIVPNISRSLKALQDFVIQQRRLPNSVPSTSTPEAGEGA